MEVTISDIRHAAMNMLARREHTARELTDKLGKKFRAANESDIGEALSGWIEEVIDQLRHEGLQSNARFIEMFINARRNRGYGPVRIAQELKQKGLDSSDYELMLDRYGEQWFEQARQVRKKKFGCKQISEAKEKARQSRFLQYRGFTIEQIEPLLNP